MSDFSLCRLWLKGSPCSSCQHHGGHSGSFMPTAATSHQQSCKRNSFSWTSFWSNGFQKLFHWSSADVLCWQISTWGLALICLMPLLCWVTGVALLAQRAQVQEALCPGVAAFMLDRVMQLFSCSTGALQAQQVTYIWEGISYQQCLSAARDKNWEEQIEK